mmetsp:Transcript_41905/g.94675  ORF Transcript_41905/g.94675 Transcript_41905/m.94675 type:complete len:124 (+) Transcript_41905:115-486(+)
MHFLGLLVLFFSAYIAQSEQLDDRRELSYTPQHKRAPADYIIPRTKEELIRRQRDFTLCDSGTTKDFKDLAIGDCLVFDHGLETVKAVSFDDGKVHMESGMELVTLHNGVVTWKHAPNLRRER